MGNNYGWPADEIPAEVDEGIILGRLLALIASTIQGGQGAPVLLALE